MEKNNSFVNHFQYILYPCSLINIVKVRCQQTPFDMGNNLYLKKKKNVLFTLVDPSFDFEVC